MRKPDPITCPHPERPHRALGMCAACYHRHWRKVTRERRERLERRLREYVEPPRAA